MIVGLGTDSVEVSRIAQSISRFGPKFTHRVFTRRERSYSESKANAAERFAARFAAKEAAMKALGTGWSRGITWTQIEVINDANGKPLLLLHDTAEEFSRQLAVKHMFLSLTHTPQIASAIVILEA